MAIKKKFIDTNLKNKSKTVKEKLQLIDFNGNKLPLPTEIEISESEHVIENVHFAHEVLKILLIKKNLLKMNFTKKCALN